MAKYFCVGTYVYDPERNHLEIYLRRGEQLERISHLKGWVSPRLEIRFELTDDTLKLYYPDGRPFPTSVELAEYAEQEHERAEQADERAEQERERAEQTAADLAAERRRTERMLARLRALGIDPAEVSEDK